MANMKQHKLGWIGIGRMGYAMAERLAKAGADISVWNRTRSKAEPLAASGAKVVDSLTDLADCIPGAKHLMFEELLESDKSFKSAEALGAAVRARDVDSGKDIITYCRMSHRATVLYFALTELLGLTRVRVYDGSWTEWGNLVGVPVER